MVIGLAILAAMRRSALVRAVWREEADALGLRCEDWIFGPRRLTGMIRGHAVRVEVVKRGEDTFTRVTLQGGRIPAGIEIRRERRRFGRSVPIGDPAFDDAVRADGSPAAVAAFLGRETRRALVELVGLGGGLKNGALTFERPGLTAAPGEIRRTVEMLVEFAAQLPSGTVPELLLANATSDESAVRKHNLELLAGQFPDAPETKVAADAALADPDPAIRLMAANLLRGERGKAALRALLEDPSASDDVLAEAVLAAGATRDASFVDPISALAKKHDRGLAEAVATALGKLGDARAETTLLRLLARDAADLKRAAATALGLAGTVQSVEPLLGSGAPASVVRDSVRRIQARLGDVEAGRLSVAPDDATAGALSPAADEGELSIAPAERRRVK
ncbi:MAG: HEAT repeat domain-containing protein [Myxococcales bacterium]